MDQETKKSIYSLLWFAGGCVGILGGIFSAWWAVHTYYKLLPLQQANVIFLESANISHSGDSACQANGATIPFDAVRPQIKNIGKAIAKDIKFKIYVIYFDESLKFPTSKDNIEMFFDDELISDLPPDTSANFGAINLTYNIDFPQEKRQVALVYNLQFADSITGKAYSRIFLFQYLIGEDKFGSLIGADYNKVCDRLIKKLETDKSDASLLNFLKNKNCIKK